VFSFLSSRPYQTSRRTTTFASKRRRRRRSRRRRRLFKTREVLNEFFLHFD
jgi:hypothetical protein